MQKGESSVSNISLPFHKINLKQEYSEEAIKKWTKETNLVWRNGWEVAQSGNGDAKRQVGS